MFVFRTGCLTPTPQASPWGTEGGTSNDAFLPLPHGSSSYLYHGCQWRNLPYKGASVDHFHLAG